MMKALIEDWIRFRWRDTVALMLIAGGFVVILHTANVMALDSAKGIIGAGLIMLDPRAMLPMPKSNGNNTTTQTTTKVQTSAEAPAASVSDWPAKPT
jgi:hypothetical protein